MSARSLLPLGAGLLLYALAFLYSVAYWAHQHDEGITFDLALARPSVGADWQDARPLHEHYAELEPAALDSTGEVLDLLWRGGSGQPHPPLYYLGLNAWAHVAGTGSLELRLPALLIGLGAILGLYALGRRMAPHGSAPGWAALLLALSPWFVTITVFLRPYGQVLCIALWASVFALRVAQRDGERRAWVGFTLLSVAGLYTLYHYVFVLVWHGALILGSSFGLERAERVRRWRALAVCALCVSLAFAPWLPALLRWTEGDSSSYHFTTGRLSAQQWPEELSLLVRRLFLDQLAPHWLDRLLWPLLALSAGALLVAGLRSRRSAHPLEVRSAWWSLPVLPAAALGTDALVGNHTFVYSKYSFLLLPLLLLSFAVAWSALAPRALGWAGLLVLVCFTASAGGERLLERARSPSDYQRIAAAIAADDKPTHLFTPTVHRRGDRIALLLCLRDAGANQSWMTTGSLRRASGLWDVMRERSDLERITFLRGYVPSRQRNRPREEPDLQQLLERARRGGWRVLQRRMDNLSELGRGRRPLLLATGPAVATFFGR